MCCGDKHRCRRHRHHHRLEEGRREERSRGIGRGRGRNRGRTGSCQPDASREARWAEWCVVDNPGLPLQCGKNRVAFRDRDHGDCNVGAVDVWERRPWWREGWEVGEREGGPLSTERPGVVFAPASCSQQRCDRWGRSRPASRRERCCWYWLGQRQRCHRLCKRVQWLFVAVADPPKEVVGNRAVDEEEGDHDHPAEEVGGEELEQQESAMSIESRGRGKAGSRGWCSASRAQRNQRRR